MGKAKGFVWALRGVKKPPGSWWAQEGHRGASQGSFGASMKLIRSRGLGGLIGFWGDRGRPGLKEVLGAI